MIGRKVALTCYFAQSDRSASVRMTKANSCTTSLGADWSAILGRSLLLGENAIHG